MIDEIICGDAITTLQSMPSGSANCCITSPPYYGLRDYGVDGQIGLEQTPDEYVTKLVEIFKEVKRVLKEDGTLWLNIGDSYAGSSGCHKGGSDKANSNAGATNSYIKPKPGKPKDLIGIPWMAAFALRADGWYLRSDIIWAKGNPMPESVTDRPTKSHEYLFLLSKNKKYYYDAEAIKEPNTKNTIKRLKSGPVQSISKHKKFIQVNGNRKNKNFDYEVANGRNKRTVWNINTKPYKAAHFAVFPEKLIEPCILAGCPEDGIVLDPFIGSGTTGVVARRLGRHFVGIELKPEYCTLAESRITKAEASL